MSGPAWGIGNIMQQLTMLGGKFNETIEPIKVGDILVTKSFGRVVVTHVSNNLDGGVYPSVRLDNGNECVVLEREILYRSR